MLRSHGASQGEKVLCLVQWRTGGDYCHPGIAAGSNRARCRQSRSGVPNQKGKEMNPINDVLQALDKLIVEHGSAAIHKEHIQLLRDQLAVNAQKIKELTFQTENLERLLNECKSQNDNLKGQLKKAGDICPYCRHATGELEKIGPSPTPDLASIGVRAGYYKCSNCGKTYDKKYGYH